MLIDDKIQELQNLIKRKITYEEIAKVLGKKSGTVVRNWSYRQRQLEEFEIQKLDEYYGKNKTEQNKTDYIPDDKIEIKYWQLLPKELKNPKIRSVWFDDEIINNAWNIKANSLVIVPMISDALSHYWYPIYNGDILIVDTSQNNVLECGLYFATSQNNSRYWIREIDVLANETIEFRRYSSGGKIVKTYTRKELQEVDFKIIGKVIKNVSFRL